MNSPTSNQPALSLERSPLLLRALLLGFSAWFGGCALVISIFRISYPFDLEWMESGSLVQMLRLLDGKALYTAPRLEYIPYIYPPLYYYLSALVAKVTSLGWYLPLRMVSLMATFGIAVLIFQVVHRQTGQWGWGFVAVGFFAATYRIGGAWFDIARVDMLFVFFLVAAAFALEKPGWLASSLAGLLFTCAFFTKQTALFVALGMLVYVFIFKDRRNALISALFFVVSSATWLWIENRVSDGWFWYYVFSLPGLHRLPAPGLVYFVQPLVLLAPVLPASLVGFARLIPAPIDALKRQDGIWLAFGITMLGTSIIGAINPGGYNNNYIPYYAALSILAGSNLPWVLERAGLKKRNFRQALVFGMCAAQFLVLLYNPLAQIPTQADLKAGQELVERLRQANGDVLIPNHNALAVLAGKTPYAHLVAMNELKGNFGSREEKGYLAITADIHQAISEHRFGAIVLDQPNVYWSEVPLQYKQSDIGYASPDVFWPLTGVRTRPTFYYTYP